MGGSIRSRSLSNSSSVLKRDVGTDEQDGSQLENRFVSVFDIMLIAFTSIRPQS